MVLGGDGFCGWPTSLYLSDRGHDITIVDNLSRRKIDIELEVESLTPIHPVSERLINRFDYDGDYGTVLNRFLMQAAIGHPLTVHGTGGQTRAFIHIRDTVRCIEIAITNPPLAGDKPRVLNQMTEVHRVMDLAKMVADVMGADIAYLPNPRREAEENDLNVRNDQFLALGLKPTTLSEGLLDEGRQVAARYRDRVDPSKIVCRSVWRAGMETADDLVTELPA